MEVPCFAAMEEIKSWRVKTRSKCLLMSSDLHWSGAGCANRQFMGNNFIRWYYVTVVIRMFQLVPLPPRGCLIKKPVMFHGETAVASIQIAWQPHSSALSKIYSQIDTFNKVWITASCWCRGTKLRWTLDNEVNLSVGVPVCVFSLQKPSQLYGTTASQWKCSGNQIIDTQRAARRISKLLSAYVWAEINAVNHRGVQI